MAEGGKGEPFENMKNRYQENDTDNGEIETDRWAGTKGSKGRKTGRVRRSFTEFVRSNIGFRKFFIYLFENLQYIKFIRSKITKKKRAIGF